MLWGRGLKVKSVMDKGKMIHVIGYLTDLWVNIEGRLAQECSAVFAISPTGVFLAPVTNGVNGEVYLICQLLHLGMRFRESTRNLRKEKDKCLKPSTGRCFAKMLETDPGARYLGEFAIGANYNITRGMLNTLFDEKIEDDPYGAGDGV